MAKRRYLFYRQIPHGDGLIFAVKEDAEYVHAIHMALKAKTWGEYRTLIPTIEYEALVEYMHQNSDDEESFSMPKDEEKFSTDAIPGFSDGDYPPWLQTRMDRYLPQEILEQYGCEATSVLNGNFWTVDTNSENEIVARLRSLGYTVEKREDLMFY